MSHVSHNLEIDVYSNLNRVENISLNIQFIVRFNFVGRKFKAYYFKSIFLYILFRPDTLLDATAVVKRCQESKTALRREQSLREDAERREISGSQDMEGGYIATMGLLGPEFHHLIYGVGWLYRL